MGLNQGARFGPYEIAEPVGSGGMGEVWRAHDTTLERDVAIKVLPESFTADPGRVARFEQEAKTLAALNHPNIAQVFGLEKLDGQTAIVMELVEGPTLADRIAQGPLPADEAMGIAMQIADALEAAHEQHIIHRDLKPANVKLRPDGTVKVLDFGIAKAAVPELASGGGPLMTTPVTQVGVILGTAAYMSPEQARGKRVDRRTDVWAFGCVLYEMLTGQLAFGGEDVAVILARVIANDTDLKSLPAMLSPAVRHTISLCLQKDPKQRLRDIGDVKLALSGAFESDSDGAGGAAPAKSQPAWRRTLPWAAGLVLAALVGLGAWQLKPEAPRSVVRFVHELPEGRNLFFSGLLDVDIADNGRRLVYNSTDGFVIRDMDAIDDRVIPGTEETRALPRLSPDGESVAFFRRRGNGVALSRTAIAGGTPVDLTLFESPALRGLSWEADGTLLFSLAGAGIYRISENGGEPELIVPAESAEERNLLRPELLPGGEWVLLTLGASTVDGTGEPEIVAQSIVTGERRSLRRGAESGRYAPTGHLLYASDATLFAIAFDPATLEVSGGPVPVAQGVRRSSSGDMQYAFSDDGTLIYLPGSAFDSGQLSLAIGDGQGRAEALAVPPGDYASPRASPDGRWIAYQALYDDGSDIAVYEIGSNAAPRRLTFGGDNTLPAWSADGDRVAYQSTRVDGNGIWWRLADGTSAEERLTEAGDGESHVPDSFSPDGRYLAYTVAGDSGSAIWLLELASREVSLLIASQGRGASHPVFSPDGNWIAYQAYDTGDNEVYVQPFPLSGNKYQLPSRGDNHHPAWSADGRQLYYIVNSTRFERVDVSTERGFSFGNPVAMNLEPLRNVGPNIPREHEVMPDGSGILGTMPARVDASASASGIVVVQNWFEELKRLVPVK